MSNAMTNEIGDKQDGITNHVLDVLQNIGHCFNGAISCSYLTKSVYFTVNIYATQYFFVMFNFLLENKSCINLLHVFTLLKY
jgi:hypothetical protein